MKNRGRFGTPYTRLAAASCGLTHTVAHMTRLHVSVRRMHLVECQYVQAYIAYQHTRHSRIPLRAQQVFTPRAQLDVVLVPLNLAQTQPTQVKPCALNLFRWDCTAQVHKQTHTTPQEGDGSPLPLGGRAGTFWNTRSEHFSSS